MPRKTAAERRLEQTRADAAEARRAKDAGLVYHSAEPRSEYDRRPGSISAAEYDRRLAAQLDAELTAPTTHPAWAAMRSEAIRLSLPRHYRTDLLIDVAALFGAYGAGYDADSLFGWHLYDTGTNLFTPAPYAKPQQRLRAEDCRRAHQTAEGEESHWYLWQPKAQRLAPVTPAQIDAALDAETERRHRAERLERQRQATAEAERHAEQRRIWYRENVWQTATKESAAQ